MKKLITITFFLLKINFDVLSQNYDSEGWSINKLSDDSRIIYVSASGDDLTAEVYDKNSTKVGSDPFLPTDEIKPFKTIKEAKKKLRVGFADWILFKKGDVFENQVFGAVQLVGKDQSNSLLIGSYGNKTERPKFLTGNKTFIYLLEKSNFIKIIGLNIVANERTNLEKTYGIIGYELNYLNIIVEDCHFDKFSTHIYLKNSVTKSYSKTLGQNYSLLINIRRNIFTNSYYQNGTYGLEFEKTSGTSIYQNYFENNGWDNLVLKKFSSNLLTGSIGIGVECFDTDVRENIICKSNGSGINVFASTSIDNNLFLENYNHVYVFIFKKDDGNSIIEDKDQYVGFSNNVFLDLMMIDSLTSNSLVNIGFFPCKTNFSYNLFLKGKNYKFIPASLRIEFNFDCYISESIFYEYGNNHKNSDFNRSSIFSEKSFFNISNSDIQNFNKNSHCIFSNNNFKSENNNYYNINDTNKWFDVYSFKYKIDYTSNYKEVSYPDPRRNINSLLNHIGLIGNIDSFFKIKSLFNKDNQNERLFTPYINNYFREGFALKTNHNYGIDNEKYKNHFLIFPNPTSNNFINIDAKIETNFKIFDFYGKIVIDGKLNEGNNQVELTNLNNGVYFINIENQYVKIVVNNVN